MPALLVIALCAALFTPSVFAQAGDDPAAPAGQSESPAPASAPPEPVPANPPVVQSQDPPAPAPVGQPEWSPSTTYQAPSSAGPAPGGGDSAPPPSASGGDSAGGPAPSHPSPEPAPSSGVGAYNQSSVLQAIWQVQVGCRTHCHGTSQTQSTAQRSDTRQDATASAPGGESSAAGAVNQSSTAQFVWQTQLGCVAFCWDTSMNQSASQDALTTQRATATSDFAALAQNLAETLQYVWQVQQGCETECYGVTQTQSLYQRQTTDQLASATGPPPGWPPDNPEAFFSWVTALAQNMGAVVQTIIQYQEASCLEHCGEEALLQAAEQLAAAAQVASAGDVPAPPPRPPAPQAAPPAPSSPPAASKVELAPAEVAAATKRLVLLEQAVSALQVGRAVSDRPDRRASVGAGAGGSDGSAAAAAAAGSANAPDSAPTAVADPSGRESERHGTAGSSSPDKDSDAPTSLSQAPVTLDQRAASESGTGPDIPWLPVALLLIAAVGVIQSLRPRTGLST